MVCRPLAICFALALLAGSAAAAAPDGGSAAAAPALLAANAGVSAIPQRSGADPAAARRDAGHDRSPRRAEDARKALGADVLDLAALAAVATDPQREILVGWGIAEAREVEAIMAAADPPVGAFTIRFVVTLPVSDPQEAPAGLAQMLACCLRPGVGGSQASRRAGSGGVSVRHRTGRVERPARPESPGAALDRGARIPRRRRGGRSGRSGAAGALRASARRGFLRRRRRLLHDTSRSGARRVSPWNSRRRWLSVSERAAATTAKRAIWRQGVEELGSIARLADSGPRMFSSLLVTERGRQWGLTAEGETVLASLGLPRVLDAKLAARLPEALGRHMKLEGPFGGDTALLTHTVMEAGQLGYVVIDEFVWPHVLAFSAHHTDMPVPPTTASRIELDRLHHRLLLTRP